MNDLLASLPSFARGRLKGVECAAEGCAAPAACRGLCDRHYSRAKRRGSLALVRFVSEGDEAARFHDKYMPEPMSGCWLWIGGARPNAKGVLYGRHHKDDGKATGAHRFSWELHRGPIPPYAMVCHRCDTPLCVNPDHLFLGDHRANMADMVAKRRSFRGAGERKGSARLSDAEASAIKRAGGSQSEIAAAFGVVQATVSRIKNGVRYAP